MVVTERLRPGCRVVKSGGELIEGADLLAAMPESDDVVALVDGEATIKRFAREKGYVSLKPASTSDITRASRMPGVVWVAGIAAAGASAWVWAGALDAYFWNDDFVWLYLLHDRPLPEVLLTPIGGSTLVLRNLVFALLDRTAGLDPVPYFASLLLTHALNVVLVARLAWRVTGATMLAGLAALAWGTCPPANR
ncbi:MAG: hypothetical protein KIT14_12415 [bacterium]|nr:hypothetical protein [bacterium]